MLDRYDHPELFRTEDCPHTDVLRRWTGTGKVPVGITGVPWCQRKWRWEHPMV